MTEGKESSFLIDLIKPETTYDELVGIISQFITEDDLIVLGDKNSASIKIANSIKYLYPIGPAPMSFRPDMFFSVSTPNLPEDVSERILQINKRMGVIQDAPNGRLSISPELVETTKQFLTDED